MSLKTCLAIPLLILLLDFAERGLNTLRLDDQVTINYFLPPIAVCNDTTIYLSMGCSITLDPEIVGQGSSDPDGDTLQYYINPSPTFGVGNHLAYLVVDDGEFIDSCAVSVTVLDTLAPADGCADIEVRIGSSGMANIYAQDYASHFTDNCEVDSLFIIAGPTNFTTSDIDSVYSITLLARDESSNAGQCMINVSVLDSMENQAPLAVCNDTTIYLSMGCSVTLDPEIVGMGSSDPDGDTLQYYINPSPTFVVGNHLAYLVVDDGEFIDSCPVSVYILDTIAPVDGCADVEVRIGSSGMANIYAEDYASHFTDNCEVDSLFIIAGPTNFTTSDIDSVYSITLLARDESSNAGQCMINVSVLDSIENYAPNAVCNDTTIYISNECSITLNPIPLGAGSSDPDGDDLTIYTNEIPIFGPGIHPLTILVSDGVLLDSCVATVTVLDTIPPLDACSHIDVYVGQSSMAEIFAEDYGSYFSDNCGIDSLFFNSGPSLFTSADIDSVYTVSLLAQDESGNSSECLFNVSVLDSLDNLPPVAICTDTTIYLQQFCSTEVDPAYLGVMSYDPEGAPLSYSIGSRISFTYGVYNLTLTVSDGVFSDSCSVVLTVLDTIAPIPNCSDIEVEVGPATPKSLEISDFITFFTDGCGPLSAFADSIWFASGQTSFTSADHGSSFGITLMASDSFWNTSSCNFNVQVIDTSLTNQPPIAICSDTTLFLSDSCALSVSPLTVSMGSYDPNDDILSYFLDPPGPYGPGAHNPFLIVSDGEFSDSCIVNLTVLDTISPQDFCEDLVVMIDSTLTSTLDPALYLSYFSDNCSIDTGFFFTPQFDFDCTDVDSMFQASMLVFDESGNSSQCDFSITVSDETNDSVLIWTDIFDAFMGSIDIGDQSDSVLLTDLIQPGDVHFEALEGVLYLAAYNMVLRTDLFGNILDTVAANPDYIITGLDVDHQNGHLYFIDHRFDSIMRVNLDGTSLQGIISTSYHTSATPYFLKVDEVNDKLYWTDHTRGEIRRCNLDGTGMEDVVNIAGESPIDLELDHTSNKMYWTDQAMKQIRRANFDGTSQDIVYAGLADKPRGLALDLINNRLFVTNDTQILELNLGSFEIDTILSGQRTALGLCVGLRPSKNAIDYCNNAPIANCLDTTLYLADSCSIPLIGDILNSGSLDPDGDDLSFSYIPSTSLGPGIHSIMMIVSDGQLLDTCVSEVRVIDTIKPVINCQHLEVQLDSVSATLDISHQDLQFTYSDNCGSNYDSIVISKTSFVCADIGIDTISMTVFDSAGNFSSCQFILTISGSDRDSDGTPDCQDECPDNPEKSVAGLCGCTTNEVDSDGDGTPDCDDECPNDPNKTVAGQCGCSFEDIDSDGDGTSDCLDFCPQDPNKIFSGDCGCGVADADNDGDGILNCQDGCPEDSLKVTPGINGCGVLDPTPPDADGDGTPDIDDDCPFDPDKVSPGTCGCGNTDDGLDSDNDGLVDCLDACPTDPNKISPGACGCGVTDQDSDGDGAADCIDQCPNDPSKVLAGFCGCNVADEDSDADGVLDCQDGCPTDSLKIAPGVNGCHVVDPSPPDTDNDGTIDTEDLCPLDPNKVTPGTCGCGKTDLLVDADGDGVIDCIDGCPENPLKSTPNITGCYSACSDFNVMLDQSLIQNTTEISSTWIDASGQMMADKIFLQAGNFITLDPGFLINAGSDMTANIDACVGGISMAKSSLSSSRGGDPINIHCNETQFYWDNKAMTSISIPIARKSKIDVLFTNMVKKTFGYLMYDEFVDVGVLDLVFRNNTDITDPFKISIIIDGKEKYNYYLVSPMKN